MKKYIIYLLPLLFLTSCKKFEIGTDTNVIFHVKNAGAEIPVQVRGNTGSGKIVLVINGGPGLSTLDVALLDLFNFTSLEKEVGVAYFDQRGTGNSQGNFDESTLTLAQNVEDLDHIIKVTRHHFPTCEIFLLGHSFGGFIGNAYLIDAHEPVSGWINVDGVPLLDTDLMWTYRHRWIVNLANEKVAAGEDTVKWNEVLTWAAANPVITETTQKNEWRAFIGYAGDGVIPEEPAELGLGGIAKLMFFSSYNIFPAYMSSNWKLVADNLYNDAVGTNQLSDLENIDVPTLICWGRYDDLLPVELAYDIYDTLSPALPERTLRIFPESGHSPFLNEPEAFVREVLDFVNRH